MIIHYHSWEAYKSCPKKFYKKFIAKDAPTVEKNEYFKLYGLLVEKFFTLFCNQWRFKTPYMPIDFIKHKLKPIYEGILKSTTVNWSEPFCKLSSEDIFEEALNDIFKIMESMNQNYFLNSTSEVTINAYLKNGHIITGRIDFIHKHHLTPENEYIIDGKGSMEIGKNVDRNQLLFYALLYYLKYSRLPHELGFFYYRFNDYIRIPFTEAMLNDFRAQLSLDIKKMTSTNNFEATPSAKSCKYCDYFNKCNEGMEAKAKRSRPSKIKKETNGNIITFGF